MDAVDRTGPAAKKERGKNNFANLCNEFPMSVQLFQSQTKSLSFGHSFCLSRLRCLSYFNILQLFCFPSAFLAHKYHKWRISWFLVVANRGWTICASLRCETLAASQTRYSCPIHHCCKAGQNLGSDYSFLEPTWTNCSAVISFLQISTGSIVFNTKLRSRVRC